MKPRTAESPCFHFYIEDKEFNPEIERLVEVYKAIQKDLTPHREVKFKTGTNMEMVCLNNRDRRSYTRTKVVVYLLYKGIEAVLSSEEYRQDLIAYTEKNNGKRMQAALRRLMATGCTQDSQEDKSSEKIKTVGTVSKEETK